MNSMVLYELHAHIAPSSPCAQTEAADALGLYQGLGYDGLVVTNHLWPEFDIYMRDGWRAAVDAVLRTWAGVKRIAPQYGLHVLLGCELRNTLTHNDYLLYGVTPEFLTASEDLIVMPMNELYARLQSAGIAIFQAHPMRHDMTLTHPAYLDGYEVFNGNPRHNSRNEMAHLLAMSENKIGISGSDFHQLGDEGIGGVLLARHPQDEAELARMLKGGEFMRVERPIIPR